MLRSSDAFDSLSRVRGRTRTLSLWLLVVCAFLATVLLYPRASLGDDTPNPADGVDLEQLEHAFEKIVQRVTPSVVGVRTHRRYLMPVPTGDGEAHRLEQIIIVNGSGTIISSDGLILTNEHVIQSADRIEVRLHDGTRLEAELVSSDPRSDLAVLRIHRTGLTPAEFADTSNAARGQWTIAVGNPFGLGSDGQMSVSVGVISNLGRRLPGLGEVDDRLYDNMLQTTASVNPGNSGGPLFNIHGEMLGIVTAMHTRAAADDGVGFAIPMTPVKRRVIEHLSHGEVISYGYLGLSVRALEVNERERAGIGEGVGVMIESVQAGGPADRAELHTGDVLVRLDSKDVPGPAGLVEMVGEAPVGKEVAIEYVRGGRRHTARARVQRRQVSRVGWMRGSAIVWRGMRLAELSTDARRRMRVSEGARGLVVIDVLHHSPADRARILVGDVIESVDGARIDNTVVFRDAVRNRKGVLKVRTRDRGIVRLDP